MTLFSQGHLLIFTRLLFLRFAISSISSPLSYIRNLQEQKLFSNLYPLVNYVKNKVFANKKCFTVEHLNNYFIPSSK